jgi:hypothetical protein
VRRAEHEGVVFAGYDDRRQVEDAEDEDEREAEDREDA